MDLKVMLKILHETSLKEGTSPPYIVGGLVRDRVAGSLNNLNDIDLTTGDSSVFQLAQDFAIKLKQSTPLLTKKALDGHISIILSDLKIDFSSNFNVPGIDQILAQKGIKNPTPMEKEVWSRDFTINTLLMSIDFRKIKDLTRHGMKDIHSKIIRTCLTPDLTFKYNVNRIIRVVYLASKLNFNVHPDIISWVKNNPEYITKCEREYLSKNINKALSFNPKKAVSLITQMNLWDYIPITQELLPAFREYGT